MAEPALALREPWISTLPGMMRGAGAAVPGMAYGDLIFPMRTNWLGPDVDPAPLRRRTLVGVWWVESFTHYPGGDRQGRMVPIAEVNAFPLRRFDFPVPVEATAQIDAHFDSVEALHDRSRGTVLPLSSGELLAVTRACGLPAAVLTTADPDDLAPLLGPLDLGPPTQVRRRITAGARATAHRRSVEAAARDVVVRTLCRCRFGAVSTENRRGIGSDIWAQAIEADGAVTELRIEVKGLSSGDAFDAVLTKCERAAAAQDAASGAGQWWLAVVTHALRSDRLLTWVSSQQVADIWSIDDGPTWRADRRRSRLQAAG